MTFGDRVVGAMKLDPNAFEDVERDPSAIGQSVGVIVLAAVAAGIGVIYAGGLSGIVMSAIMSLIGFLIWSLIVWVIGTKAIADHAFARKALRDGGYRPPSFPVTKDHLRAEMLGEPFVHYFATNWPHLVNQ